MQNILTTKVLQPDFGLLLVRLSSGFSMLFFHGWGKLTSFADRVETFADPLGVGSPVSLGLTVFAEVLCALMFALGFLTRLAALPLAFTMFMAAFFVHAGDPWSERELALVYFTIYLGVMISGPGKFSLDKWLFKW
jgi:putative oxidoreductase